MCDGGWGLVCPEAHEAAAAWETQGEKRCEVAMVTAHEPCALMKTRGGSCGNAARHKHVHTARKPCMQRWILQSKHSNKHTNVSPTTHANPTNTYW